MKNYSDMSKFKQIAIDIVLIMLFAILIAVITILFITDENFKKARKLEIGYRWENACAEYRRAIEFDPFNAEHIAGYGDFLRSKSIYQEDTVGWLKQAEKLYTRALELNPHCAQYSLYLGLTKLDLFLLDKDKFADKLVSGLNDFKKALRNDPNGFNISYSIGYAGMAVWDRLKPDDKELILDRLKYSLGVYYWYSKHIYPQLLKATNDFRYLQQITPKTLKAQYELYNFIRENNLWQFRKELKGFEQEIKEKRLRIQALKEEYTKKGLGYLNSVSPELWKGKSKDGISVYENGNMYWTGTMDAVVNVPEGKATLKIRARGSQADSIWPYMIVELDGEETGETFVDSPEWKEYSFQIDTDGGVNVLSITFANDGGNKEEDRNLYVGEAKIIENE